MVIVGGCARVVRRQGKTSTGDGTSRSDQDGTLGVALSTSSVAAQELLVTCMRRDRTGRRGRSGLMHGCIGSGSALDRLWIGIGIGIGSDQRRAWVATISELGYGAYIILSFVFTASVISFQTTLPPGMVLGGNGKGHC